MTALRIFALLIGHFAVVGAAHAQTTADSWASARFHLGAVALNPTISIVTGIDTNVLAQPENPQRDWIGTLTTGSTAILRLGRARLTGQGELLYEYFHKFESERSLGGRGVAGLHVPLNRVELVVDATILSSEQRQGTEITARVRRFESGVNVGANVRVAGQSWLGLTAGRQRHTFPDDDVYLGTDLSTVLDRQEDRFGIVFSNQLTPLTTFRLRAEVLRDRFDQATSRDADSVRVSGGIETGPQALLNGSAFVGYQRYQPVAAGVPEFAGVVASADLSYVFRASTRLSVRVDRGLDYSYDVVEPYYISNDITAGITRSSESPPV